jgi:hypothetical protein
MADETKQDLDDELSADDAAAGAPDQAGTDQRDNFTTLYGSDRDEPDPPSQDPSGTTTQ